MRFISKVAIELVRPFLPKMGGQGNVIELMSVNPKRSHSKHVNTLKVNHMFISFESHPSINAETPSPKFPARRQEPQKASSTRKPTSNGGTISLRTLCLPVLQQQRPYTVFQARLAARTGRPRHVQSPRPSSSLRALPA